MAWVEWVELCKKDGMDVTGVYGSRVDKCVNESWGFDIVENSSLNFRRHAFAFSVFGRFEWWIAKVFEVFVRCIKESGVIERAVLM